MSYRAIVAARIGRPLTSGEEVHHINGRHHDDRPDNLLLTTYEQHRQIHAAMRRMRRTWADSAFYRFVCPPLGYTYDETIELTRCTNPSILAELGHLEWVRLDEWQWGFTIPSVDAFVASGGLRSLREKRAS